ncbi:MAG: aldehyde dehydrogenase family protein [Chloroflexi bacterium]|nr:MAG: aldehyde dehydrogenase family protein [Chloroflexota bacterium]MBL1197146.1 aldehyde dehydrogenase family protein [Chloroflexota bacterium]NOH14441.1 aldehyde dehydrogenase family protein [Chloroflexota bacterium]
MAEFDKDLRSIQQARQMVTAARDAQRIWAEATQEQVDRVCAAMVEVAYQASERLGRMASEETGYGVPEHKKLKNEFASKHVWDAIRDIKTVGVVRHDPTTKIYEIAWPMGVVAALTPSTNPTSTVMNKILISVKARNGIVIAPHPSAVNCCVDTAQLMANAAYEAGAPEGLIHCMSEVSLPGTDELLSHRYTAVILATGGTPMVRAAHSKGKPAYGVGPGNVPVYVDRSADLERAAKYIVASKAFDHSVICATEQAIIADKPIARRLEELVKAEGAYFVNEAQAEALRNTLFHPNGAINADTVGKSPQVLAAMAGITVPETARILVVRLNSVGRDEALSREKLTTVLGWYEADGWEAGCDICLDMIHFGGRGHSLIIHATDEDVIMRFGLEKPVFRIAVNTMATLGAIGLTTKVMPSMTLGSGGVGGSITGDNITVYHLFNIKRMAYEAVSPPEAALRPGSVGAGPIHGPSSQELAQLVEKTVKEILGT